MIAISTFYVSSSRSSSWFYSLIASRASASLRSLIYYYFSLTCCSLSLQVLSSSINSTLVYLELVFCCKSTFSYSMISISRSFILSICSWAIYSSLAISSNYLVRFSYWLCNWSNYFCIFCSSKAIFEPKYSSSASFYLKEESLNRT